MNWDEILKYQVIINKIAMKYSNDPTLAEDVAHEVMIKLFEDKKLDTNKFDPNKKDAAIRNTIRNKTLKVLRSKKIGRWQFESIDKLNEMGYQIDDAERVVFPEKKDKPPTPDEYEALGRTFSDNNVEND